MKIIGLQPSSLYIRIINGIFFSFIACSETVPDLLITVVIAVTIIYICDAWYFFTCLTAKTKSTEETKSTTRLLI